MPGSDRDDIEHDLFVWNEATKGAFYSSSCMQATVLFYLVGVILFSRRYGIVYAVLSSFGPALEDTTILLRQLVAQTSSPYCV